jgi:uncharacterized membrane protein
MVTWLVLLLLFGFVIHLNSRLRGLERRLDEVQSSIPYAISPEWVEPTAPDSQCDAPPGSADDAESHHPEFVAYEEDYQSEPLTQPIPAAEYEEQASSSWSVGIGFEELFGRRLPIWAGGITLAVAGMLIVKLSIESGLLRPLIRVCAGLLFGALLIAAAELALRCEDRIRDPRVRQALAGAGVASLYASILVAANLYHLVEPFTAMLGLAAVTALALFLSIRFGPPSALLGLAGGLAAPALIGSNEPNVPLLSVYLALAVSGLCTLSRNQRWAWLGISALIGGFGWGILLLLGGILDAPSAISLGLYLLLLGVGIPALGFAGGRKNQLQLIAGIVAAAQMAALVATGGFALLNWALFAMLSIASIWLAQRDAALTRLPAVGLLIALLLLAAWPSPTVLDFALVMSGFVLIYGAPAAWRLWRSGGLIEAAEIGVLGLGALLLPMFHFHRADGANDLIFGLLAFGLSLPVAACAASGWTIADRRNDARFALLATVAAVLVAAAAVLLLPIWMAGVAIGIFGLALLQLGQIAEDARFEPIAWVFAATGALAYPYARIVDGIAHPDRVDAVHWGLQAGIAMLFAWRARFSVGRGVAQFLAPLFLYFAIASLVSATIEPLIAPVLLVATAWIGSRLDEPVVPAMVSSILVICAWSVPPLLFWSAAGVASLGRSPMLVTSVPAVRDALTQLAVPGVFVAAALGMAVSRLRRPERMVGWAIAGVLIAIGVHSLYKQLFEIATPEAFVRLGLAERTLWEVVLAALAALCLRLRQPQLALILSIGAAAHEALYTLLLHNPLWTAQAVGNWPIMNLLLAAYALAMGLTIALERAVKATSVEAARILSILQMVLVVLFAFSELRQLFHGSLLVTPGLLVAEDILRSILAIALAIGFLLWGIARQQRDWRIASLALMLAAVAKVFLFDASGLEGLIRIASFVALGLSLIGIGWLYARHLGADRLAVAQA